MQKFLAFYRAMHHVALSAVLQVVTLLLFVRLSVTLMYRGHIGWIITSKVITRIKF